MAKDTNVEVAIITNLKGLTSGLKKGVGHLQSFATRVGKSVDVAAKHIARIGAAATGAAIALGKIGVDFERQMATVSTMLTGPAEKLLPQLSKGVRKMARKFGESTETLSKGLYDILSAGIDASKALGVLETSAIAATAGVSDTGTAADALTTVMNSFKLQAKDAMSVADLLFAIVARGKTTFGEIGAKIGMVAAGAATSGQSLEDMGATLATMTRNGIKTDQAVTSLAGILRVFAGASDEQKKAARAFGFELSTTWLKANGLGEVLKRLKGQSPEVVKAIFQESEAVKGLSAMLQDAEGYAKDLHAMQNRAGQAMTAYGKQAGTVSFKIKKAWQKLVDIGREVGLAMLGPLADLVDKYGPKLDAMGKSVGKWFRRNGSSIDDAIWGFADGFQKGILPSLKRLYAIAGPLMRWLGVSLKRVVGDMSKLEEQEKRLERRLSNLKSGALLVDDPKKAIADTAKALETLRGEKAAKGAAALGETIGNVVGVLIEIRAAIWALNNPIKAIVAGIPAAAEAFAEMMGLGEDPESMRRLTDIMQRVEPPKKGDVVGWLDNIHLAMNEWIMKQPQALQPAARKAMEHAFRTLERLTASYAKGGNVQFSGMAAPWKAIFDEHNIRNALKGVDLTKAGKPVGDAIKTMMEGTEQDLMDGWDSALEKLEDAPDYDPIAAQKKLAKKYKGTEFLVGETPIVEAAKKAGEKAGPALSKSMMDSMLESTEAATVAKKAVRTSAEAIKKTGWMVGEKLRRGVVKGLTASDDISTALSKTLDKAMTKGLTKFKPTIPAKAFDKSFDRASTALQSRITKMLARMPKDIRKKIEAELGAGLDLDKAINVRDPKGASGEYLDQQTNKRLIRLQQAIKAWLSRMRPEVASKLKQGFLDGLKFTKKASPSIKDVLTDTLSAIGERVESAMQALMDRIHGIIIGAMQTITADALSYLSTVMDAAASISALAGGGAVSVGQAASSVSNVSNAFSTAINIRGGLINERFLRTELLPAIQRAQQMGVYK